MAYVLISDDEPDSAEVIEKFLRRAGYETRTVGNGREALTALTEKDVPSAMILDVRMPEMDGIELLQVMRSYLRWQSVPVFLVTANATGEQEERARELGVVRVFRKPSFQMADLLAGLREVAPLAGVR